MTEAEKQAIEYLNELDKTKIFYNNPPSYHNLSMGGAIVTILNLIEKKRTEIKCLKCLHNKQVMIIDEMAQFIWGEDTIFRLPDDVTTPEEVKEYFKKKVNSSEQE